MTVIVFANEEMPIVPDIVIIHANEDFRVQWTARNAGDKDVEAFVDRLVVTSIPEGCPGSDSEEHEVVFDADVEESPLPAGAAGELVEQKVGPFPAGSYRLTVTLANDLGEGVTRFNCIEIIPPR
jgi:hypothetical protein